MTVGELEAQLAGIEDKTRVVYMASDPEGNWYSELAGLNLNVRAREDEGNYGTNIIFEEYWEDYADSEEEWAEIVESCPAAVLLNPY